jgi:hypothetical protein
MYQIVYVSEAAVPFSPNDLRELLTIARRKNMIAGVTGMLVHYVNQFLQVLEGDAVNVVSTYDRIAKDARHQSLLVLHRGYSHVGKTFRECSMGFHSMALTERLPEGFREGSMDLATLDGLAALEFLLACRHQAELA